MHNIRLRPHEVGTVSALRKVMFWVKTEGVSPDPERVPLSLFKKDDSWFAALKRGLNSLATCAAGMAARTELRDDGAGKTKAFGVQWCNAMVTEDLIKEVEEHVAYTTEAEMKGIAELIWVTLHKGTGIQGGQTASLSMAQLVSRVPELVASHKYLAGRRPDASRQPVQSGKQSVRAKKRAAATAAATGAPAKAAKTPRQPPAAAAKAGFVDKVGELGPNGLPRMVGGNGAGEKCKRHAAGKCGFDTCSYSHK
jgi:hypothetical protein